MATATEDKHRKVLVTPQTKEDEGLDGYAYVNGVTVKYRFGEPTSLRASIIDFIKDIKVVTRMPEEFIDYDKKKKVRIVKREVKRYKVFELGKDYQLGPEFDDYNLDEEETGDKTSTEAP